MHKILYKNVGTFLTLHLDSKMQVNASNIAEFVLLGGGIKPQNISPLVDL